METHRRINLPPDNSIKRRVKQAGATGVAGLSIMGGVAVERIASDELQSIPAMYVVSAEDLHGAREVSLQNESESLGQERTESLTNEVSPDNENVSLVPAEWWPVAVKQHWLDIQDTAKEYQLDPYLVATIVAEESGGQNLTNRSGAQGLMQIMPGTAQEIARLRHMAYYDMSVESQNLDFGCWLIRYLDEQYIGGNGVDITTDMGLAMLAVGYGDGEGALQVWMSNGYQPQHLSDQARHVTPLWTDMYHNRNSTSSSVYTQLRGGE